MEAELPRRRVLFGVLKLVGGIDLAVELDGLDRRPLEPQHLVVAGSVGRRPLDLKGAAESIRVVLQDQDPGRRRWVVGVEQHQAAAEQAGGAREVAHRFRSGGARAAWTAAAMRLPVAEGPEPGLKPGARSEAAERGAGGRSASSRPSSLCTASPMRYRSAAEKPCSTSSSTCTTTRTGRFIAS